MTDEQIIKALECCNAEKIDCRKCPYRFKDNFNEYRMCFSVLSLDAADLAQRQKAEIERLRELNAMIIEAGQSWEQRYKTARADAVREFAAELSEEIRSAIYSSYKNYSPVDPESYHTFIGKSAALRGVYEAMGEILQKMTGEGEK